MYKQQIINVDKLQININQLINTDFLTDKNDFKLVLTHCGGSGYRVAYDVYYKKLYFGKFFINYYSNVTSNMFTFANKILYTDDFGQIFLDFMKAYNLNNYRFSLVEIAVDTTNQIREKIYDLDRRKRLNLDKDYIPHTGYFQRGFTVSKKIINSDSTVYIQKQVDRTPEIRIENKTNELKKSNKYYISNLHKKYFNLDSKIYRYELEIHPLYLLRSKSTKFIKYTSDNLNFGGGLTETKFNKLSDSEKEKYYEVETRNFYEGLDDIKNLQNDTFLYSVIHQFSKKIMDYHRLIKVPKIALNGLDKETRVITPQSEIDAKQVEVLNRQNKDFDSLF